jgi:UDP-glucose 4-epimerase
MRVLVTGGAGFVGSHVLDRLQACGHEPRNFDLVPSPYHCNGNSVDTVIGDLRDEDAVRAAVRGCEAILHLAAVADVNEVVEDPVRAEDVNVRGTRILLDAARAEGVAQFVYASTVWVYGNAVDATAVTEDTPLSLPTHLYTATKLAGEMYTRSYDELYGTPHTILRFGIPYGPRARTAAVLAAFVARARAGEPLSIAGDGAQTRQFVYVEDLADGIVSSLVPRAVGRTYNLVRDESVSIRQIADIVRELVADVPVVHGPARAADVTLAQVSGARAALELGWSPATTFAEGARRYVESLSATSGSPSASAASMIAGSAATVFRHDSGAL